VREGISFASSASSTASSSMFTNDVPLERAFVLSNAKRLIPSSDTDSAALLLLLTAFRLMTSALWSVMNTLPAPSFNANPSSGMENDSFSTLPFRRRFFTENEEMRRFTPSASTIFPFNGVYDTALRRSASRPHENSSTPLFVESGSRDEKTRARFSFPLWR